MSIKINGRLYLAHRLAFLYMTGEFPQFQVDHIDRTKTNNRWANLREATGAQNKQNTKHSMPRNTTGLLGVSRSLKRYIARIQSGGKSIYLGTFQTALGAHAAYRKAKKIHHPFGMMP